MRATKQSIQPFDKLRAPSPVEGLDRHARSAGQQNRARDDKTDWDTTTTDE
jgi:hypothetical protein